jgi:hypothetical protein
LFLSRSRFLKSRFFSRDLSSSRWLSRSSGQIEAAESFEISRDFSRLIETSRHYGDFLRYFRIKNLDKLRNLKSRNVIKLTNSRSRSRPTVEFCQKCHVSTDFSISIEAFGTGRWRRDKIETNFLKLSRSGVSIEITSRQTETPNRRNASYPLMGNQTLNLNWPTPS